MTSEAFLSPRDLQKEQLIGWALFLIGSISAILLILLFWELVKTDNAFIGTLLLGGIVFGWSVSSYIFKEAKFLFDVRLSPESLLIEKIYTNSEKKSLQYDWVAIKNIVLVEEFNFRTFSGYKLKLSFILDSGKVSEEEEFSLRMYDRSYEKQRELYNRISSFWMLASNEMTDNFHTVSPNY